MVSKQVFNFIINEFDYKLTETEPSYYISSDKRLSNKSTPIINSVILKLRKYCGESSLYDSLKAIRINFDLSDPTHALINPDDHCYLIPLFKDSGATKNNSDEIIISEIMFNEFLNLSVYMQPKIDKEQLVQDLNTQLNKYNFNYNIQTQKIEKI